MAYRPIEISPLANETYDRALRRGFWRGLIRKLGNRCNDLVPVSDLLEQMRIVRQVDLGLQQVPIKRIIGSGRTRDFDLSFNPKWKNTNNRWQSIAQANLDHHNIAPPLMLKIEEAYFVVDGNHRISVARALGRNFVEANVTEIYAENLTARPSCSRLGFRLNEKGSC